MSNLVVNQLQANSKPVVGLSDGVAWTHLILIDGAHPVMPLPGACVRSLPSIFLFRSPKLCYFSSFMLLHLCVLLQFIFFFRFFLVKVHFTLYTCVSPPLLYFSLPPSRSLATIVDVFSFLPPACLSCRAP